MTQHGWCRPWGPMLLRVVDYVANPGGGVRFLVELLAALSNRRDDLRIELISHGTGLARYLPLIEPRLPGVRLVVTSPRRRPFLQGRWRHRLPGATGLQARLFGAGSLLRWQVSPQVFDGADVVWFPWVPWHEAPPPGATHVVGSYHDAIMHQCESIMPAALREAAWQLEKGWFDSQARIVVSSEATRCAIASLFGTPTRPVSIVRLSADHAAGVETAPLPAAWDWVNRPFILCPANTTAHKNHETLLAGFAAWNAAIPLVLCGAGTDFTAATQDPRGAELHALAGDLGLLTSGRLITLGYVSDALYYALLQRAWAVVMPTLAEGGGSFPVMEAMQLGIPVICSDIPVLREQVSFYGGRPLWFEPLAAGDLTDRLAALQLDEVREREAAQAARSGLLRRGWDDVAADYMKIFTAASSGGA